MGFRRFAGFFFSFLFSFFGNRVKKMCISEKIRQAGSGIGVMLILRTKSCSHPILGFIYFLWV